MSDGAQHPPSPPTTSSAQQPPQQQDSAYKVYRPPQQTTSPAAPELPDEYFSPTASDLQLAQATLASRTQNLVNAPLQLRANRDAAAKAKLDKWPTTTIRIRFSDRTQLEKSFPSTDKIKSVYAFVRNSLREDVQPIKFVLYQPPKRELKVSDPEVRDQTLAQLQLAPSSVLLLRFLDDSLNGSNIPAPLASTMLSQAIDLPPPPDYTAQSQASSTASQPKRQKPSSGTVGGGEKKVPKWLKLGKK